MPPAEPAAAGTAAGAGGGGARASRHRYATRARPGGRFTGGGAAGAGGAGGAASQADETALATIAAGLQPAQLSKPERQLFGGAKMKLYLKARDLLLSAWYRDPTRPVPLAALVRQALEAEDDGGGRPMAAALRGAHFFLQEHGHINFGVLGEAEAVEEEPAPATKKEEEEQQAAAPDAAAAEKKDGGGDEDAPMAEADDAPTAPPKGPPTERDVVFKLYELLEAADMATTTEKSLRRALAAAFAAPEGGGAEGGEGGEGEAAAPAPELPDLKPLVKKHVAHFLAHNVDGAKVVPLGYEAEFEAKKKEEPKEEEEEDEEEKRRRERKDRKRKQREQEEADEKARLQQRAAGRLARYTAPVPAPPGRIAVIGAGPAGLAAATVLARCGADVVVLEARPRPGGRVHSFEGPGFEGCPVDLGASLITGTEPDPEEGLQPDPSSLLCKQLGVPLRLLRAGVMPLLDGCGGAAGEKSSSAAATLVDAAVDRETDALRDALLDAARERVDEALAAIAEAEAEGAAAPADRAAAEAAAAEARALIDSLSLGAALDGALEALLAAGGGDGKLPKKEEQDKEKDADNGAAGQNGQASAPPSSSSAPPSLPDAVTPAHRALLDWHWAGLEYGCSASLDQLSAAHWNQDEDAGGFGGPHCMVVGGYGRLMRALASQLEAAGRLRLGAAVSALEYGSDAPGGGVRVRLADGSTVDCAAAVVTVPLGVLKASVEAAAGGGAAAAATGALRFSPPLPDWKAAAVGRLGFGTLNKVIMRFDRRFWADAVAYSDDDNANAAAAAGADANADAANADAPKPPKPLLLPDFFGITRPGGAAGRGRCFQFWDLTDSVGLDPSKDEAPFVLAALVAGAAAREQDASKSGAEAEAPSSVVASTTGDPADAACVAAALGALRDALGPEAVPEQPAAAVVTRWARDPFARGSYSYVAVGSDGTEYDALAKPLAHGRLLFAGEHTARQHPDTVGGAMLSGMREAARALDALRRLAPDSPAAIAAAAALGGHHVSAASTGGGVSAAGGAGGGTEGGGDGALGLGGPAHGWGSASSDEEDDDEEGSSGSGSDEEEEKQGGKSSRKGDDDEAARRERRRKRKEKRRREKKRRRQQDAAAGGGDDEEDADGRPRSAARAAAAARMSMGDAIATAAAREPTRDMLRELWGALVEVEAEAGRAGGDGAGMANLRRILDGVHGTHGCEAALHALGRAPPAALRAMSRDAAALRPVATWLHALLDARGGALEHVLLDALTFLRQHLPAVPAQVQRASGLDEALRDAKGYRSAPVREAAQRVLARWRQAALQAQQAAQAARAPQPRAMPAALLSVMGATSAAATAMATPPAAANKPTTPATATAQAAAAAAEKEKAEQEEPDEAGAPPPLPEGVDVEELLGPEKARELEAARLAAEAAALEQQRAAQRLAELEAARRQLGGGGGGGAGGGEAGPSSKHIPSFNTFYQRERRREKEEQQQQQQGGGGGANTTAARPPSSSSSRLPASYEAARRELRDHVAATCKPAYKRKEVSQEGVRGVADKVTDKILGSMAARGKPAPERGFIVDRPEGHTRKAADEMIAYYLKKVIAEERAARKAAQAQGGGGGR